MRRKTATWIMVSLLVTGFAELAAETRIDPIAASGKTHRVGPYSWDNFARIQEAVDHVNVTDGDTILVEETTLPYYENVTVWKSLIIRNYPGDAPVVDCINDTRTVFRVTAPNVEISGFIVKNGYYGILVTAQSAMINNNTLMSNREGIRVANQGAMISNNTVKTNFFGIELSHSEGNVLVGNRMSENTWNFGIDGSDVAHYVHDIDESNTVNGKPIYYWKDHEHDGETIPSDAGYVGIVNSTGITVQNVSLRDNYQGVLVVGSTNILIRNLGFSTSSSLVYPIELFATDYSILQEIKSESNAATPVTLTDSHHNRILDNHITSDGFGIELSQSDYNLVANNQIVSSAGNIASRGIDLVFSSNNTVVGNNFSQSRYGMGFTSSNGSIIFHNNFLDNQQRPFFSNSVNNRFNNSYEGNYWWDYSGPDSNRDGIGDIPHDINIFSNTYDYHPLEDQWNDNRTFDRPIFSAYSSVQIAKLYTHSNATVNLFNFRRFDGHIGPYGWMYYKGNLSLWATSGFDGFLKVTIPRVWLDANFTIYVDGNPNTSCLIVANTMYSSIYVNFTKGTHFIVIIAAEAGNIVGDLNGDGMVSILDVVLVTGNYGKKETP